MKSASYLTRCARVAIAIGVAILALSAVSGQGARPHLNAAPTCEDMGGHLEVYGDLSGHRWTECDK